MHIEIQIPWPYSQGGCVRHVLFWTGNEQGANPVPYHEKPVMHFLLMMFGVSN